MNPTTMITVSGRRVDVLRPSPDDFRIEDIAHSLSQLCRYTGHTNRFYSVAEHCLNVRYLADPQDKDPQVALWALLHDAHEAYIGDISTPVKAALGEQLRIMEADIDAAIYDWLDWVPPLGVRGAVKYHDINIVPLEWRALMPDLKMFPDKDNATPQLVPMGSPYQVATMFVREFHSLRGRILGETTNLERPSNIRVGGSTYKGIVDPIPAPLS